MQSIDELELPYFPTDQADFASDPAPWFAAAREQHPWLGRCHFGYIVHDFQAMKDLMGMHDKMHIAHHRVVELMGGRGTSWGNDIDESMQAQNGPAHKRLRDIVAPAFTPRQAEKRREMSRQVIRELLDEWAPRETFDFEEFAAQYPITIMCRVIGASPDVIPELRDSLEAIGLAFGMDPSILPRLNAAVDHMTVFVEALVAARRRGERESPEPDLLDDLLAVNGEDGLTDAELVNLLIFLFVAGYDTSKNLMTLMMYALLDHPDMYAKCAQDIGYCRKVIDETLRYHGPTSTMRVNIADVVYRDVLIPEDTTLFFPLNVAGRGPSAIERGEEFDPERATPAAHLGFGRGPHICLGMFLAKVQVEEGMHEIAQRLHRPQLAGEFGWRPYAGVWGLRGLPLRFEAA